MKEKFSVYASPILARTKSTDPKTTLSSSLELNRVLEKITKEHPNVGIIGKSNDAEIKRVKKIFADPESFQRELRVSFCGAHRGMYLFDAFADIYACWEITGNTEARIGRITNDGGVEMNESLVHEWRSRTVASNPVCSKCRYAMHCGGGCASLAHARSGKLHTNYCDKFASRFRENIAKAYREYLADQGVAV